MIINQESKINPFIDRAWTEHFPLYISPQCIWLLILQSISIYIYNKKATNPLIKANISEDDNIKLTPLPSQTIDPNTPDDQSMTHTATNISNKECIMKIKELLSIIETDIIIDTETNDLISTYKYTNSNYINELSVKLCAMNPLLNSYEYNEATACGFPVLH